ncbi:MAG: hypothetical protein KC482_08850 [Dehalococcoidia bacterium]|nr:hypothetical protein [Dehalococcoidia bacterium]MCA9844921.1 hypothetical protein [Dehalococcoidia bacterium]MCA9853693.1 hypothetical protein [Dehalococcoidia bacterium]
MPEIADDSARRPWDPMPKEPGTSYAGFVQYREQPAAERSLRVVALRLGRSPSLIERYSSRYQWVSRTQAFDADQARRRAEDALQVQADWVGRLADHGRRLQSLGLAGLSQLFERDGEGNREGLKKLKPQDLIRMIAVGSHLEVTAATNSFGTLEDVFVQRVLETVATVFMEVNEHDSAEERTAAFAAGCLRAFGQLDF